jgi:PRC-barrel domain
MTREGDDVEVPDYRSLGGVEVTNQDGERLGKIEGLFVDDQVEVPTWVAVHSGLLGTHHALLPLAQARFVDGRLLVPYAKDDLALAPHHDPARPLTVEQEQVLFAHYNVGYSDADAPGPHTGVEAYETGLTGSPDAGSHPVDLGEVAVLAPGVPGVPGLPTARVSPRLRRYQPPESG